MARIDRQSSGKRNIIDFRALGIHDVAVLGRYNYSCAHPRLDDHEHKGMIEIVLIDKGRQLYHADGRDYQVKGGEIFVTNPDTVHGTGDSPEEKGAIYWMLVRVPPAGGRFLNLTVKQSRVLSSQLLNIGTRHFKCRAEMKPMLEKIFSYHQQTGNSLAIINIINLLTRFLLDVIDCALHCEQRSLSEQIRLITEYIEINISGKIRLEFLARKIDLSLSRFKARFKQETGIPPAEYIQRRKIECARHFLTENKKQSITEIAYSLEYSSSQYFATVFKRYTGLTPGEYRRMERRKGKGLN